MRNFTDEELEVRADLATGEMYETFDASDEAEDEWVMPEWKDVLARIDREAEERLRLHRAMCAARVQCAQCLSERKDVVADRISVRPDAVCCEVA